MSEQEQTYRTSKAAARIGVCSRTLKRWIKSGFGPAYTELNGNRYFTETALAEFLSKHAKTPEAK